MALARLTKTGLSHSKILGHTEVPEYYGGDLTIAGALFLMVNMPRHKTKTMEQSELKVGLENWGKINGHGLYVSHNVLSLAGEQLGDEISKDTGEPFFNGDTTGLTRRKYAFPKKFSDMWARRAVPSPELTDLWDNFCQNPGGSFINPYRSIDWDSNKTNPVFWGRMTQPYEL